MLKLRFIVLLFFSFFSNAQKLEIRTLDSLGKPSANINVQLLKNNNVFAFQKTDSSGKCIFEVKTPGIYTLKFTSVFFKTKILEINTDLQSEFTVQLEEQLTEIETVKIKPPSKIVFLKSDTLKYNINAIKDGTERSTEDLIKKLPGLDINSNGKVTYKGKILGQILVENSEFFGKNHSIATKNINANMIESIELWKDFTTMNGNSSTALNLKLKEEYKGKISGNIDLNYGLKNSYLAHVNLYQFSKVGNLALISDFNNIAKNPLNFSDFLDMNTQENVENTENQIINEIPSFLNNDGRVKSIDNQFGALQYSKSNKKFSIAAFSIINNSNLTKQLFTNRTFLNNQFAGSNFTENREENNSGFLGTTQFKLKYNLPKKSFLFYSFGYNPLQDAFKQNTDRFSDNSSTYYILENVNRNNFNNFLSWNKEVNNTKFTFSLSQINEKNSSNLGILSNENQTFFKNQNSFEQKFDINSDQYKIDFLLKNRNKLIDFKYRSGFSHKKEILSLDENLLNDFENQKLTFYQYTNSFNFSKKLSKFNLSATVASNFLAINNINQHFFENNFTLKFNPVSIVNSEFELSYNSNVTTPTLKYLNKNPIFTRDLTFYQNETLFPEFLSKKESFQFSWSRFNFRKGNFFFFLLRFENMSPFASTNVINYETISGVGNTIGFNRNAWFSHIIMENRFSKPYILKSKLVAVVYNTPDFINNIENLSTAKNLEISQTISSNYKGTPIQFELGYSFSKNIFTQSLFNNASSQNNYKFILGIKGNLKQVWIGNILGEYLIQKVGENNLNNFLLGGQLSYKKENSLFEYNLLFNNLLNLNSFSYINLNTSQFGIDQSIITALHGNILGGIKYYF